MPNSTLAADLGLGFQSTMALDTDIHGIMAAAGFGGGAAVLAQFNPLSESTPPPSLPSVPQWESLLFERPYVLAVGLLLAGITALVVLNRQGRARQGLAAAVIAITLGLGAELVNRLVVTPRERMRSLTVELIGAAASADTARLAPMLAEDVVLSIGTSSVAGAIGDFEGVGGGNARTGAGGGGGGGKDRILALVDRYPGTMYRVKSHSLAGGGAGRGVQAIIDSRNSARTQVRVRAEVESVGLVSGSWWRLHWRLDPATGAAAEGRGGSGEGVWRVTGIDLLQIDGVGDVRQLRP